MKGTSAKGQSEASSQRQQLSRLKVKYADNADLQKSAAEDESLTVVYAFAGAR